MNLVVLCLYEMSGSGGKKRQRQTGLQSFFSKKSKVSLTTYFRIYLFLSSFSQIFRVLDRSLKCKTPDKLFITVPNEEKERRNFKSASRDLTIESVSSKTLFYVSENHFHVNIV